MKLIALGLLTASLTFGQTIIKGHHLGETVQEFLAAEPAITKTLQDCHDQSPRPITPADLAKLNKAEIRAMADSVEPLGVSKKTLADLSERGKLFTPDRRVYKDHCETLIQVIEKGEKGYATPAPSELYPAYGFTDGHLSFMFLSLPGSFVHMQEDFSARAGTAAVVTHPHYSNTFGATWEDNVATWRTPELVAKLTESNDPASQSLGLQIISRQLSDKEDLARAAKPSPLD